MQSNFEALESDGHLCFTQVMIIDKHSSSSEDSLFLSLAVLSLQKWNSYLTVVLFFTEVCPICLDQKSRPRSLKYVQAQFLFRMHWRRFKCV